MPFDLQPVLRGGRLELTPLRTEDFDALYAVASDPHIWEQHPARDRYKEDVFRRFFQEGLESGGAFIVRDLKDGAVIGSSRFHGYSEDRDGGKSEIEIGWTFLARSHWGGICNREMKHLMLRHAFRFVSAVIFLVGPGNLRSQGAMEKIGGVRAGSRTDAHGGESLVFRIEAGVTVRQAGEAILPVVVPLFDAYRQFYHQPSDLARAESFLRERLTQKQSVIFVAFESAHAIGFAQLYPSFSSAAMGRIFILNDLFVAPEARGNGAGAALIQAAAEYGRHAGAVRLVLSTALTNGPAQALYEKHGWKRDTVFCAWQLAL